ncbi:DMT family transporter [Modestobacter sp. NPDC049651]|uniref:DMT family transporter n=1 Tax=unclassified Modestobacter TaxID=2643866 RepID=UPI0033CA7545
MVLGTALALLTALLNALAASYQQRASQLVAERGWTPRRPDGIVSRYLPVLRQFGWLLKHPVWWLGWVFNTLGTITQAGALHYGSVARVQPLMTTQLVFDLPLSARETRRKPLPRDWAAVVAICAGVAVFLAVPGAAPGSGAADRPAVLLSMAASAGLIVVLVALAAGRSSLTRAALYGVASGICHAATAVNIKLTIASLAGPGVWATARDWPGYGIAVSTVLGVLLAQQAYAAGSLAVAVAASTVTAPVISYVLGVYTFDVPLPHGAGTISAVVVSLVLLSVGAVVLAHSPSTRAISAQAAERAGAAAGAGAPPGSSARPSR